MCTQAYENNAVRSEALFLENDLRNQNSDQRNQSLQSDNPSFFYIFNSFRRFS